MEQKQIAKGIIVSHAAACLTIIISASVVATNAMVAEQPIVSLTMYFGITNHLDLQ